MAESFDKTLHEFAQEQNAAVDYEAMRRRILDAHAKEQEQKQKWVNPVLLRRISLAAACVALCVAAGTLLSRGGSPKESAPSLTAEQADTAEVAEAANAPMMEAYSENSAGFEAGADEYAAEPAAAGGRMVDEPLAGAAVYDPYTVLINREHRLEADDVPGAMVELNTLELPNIKLKKDGMLADATAAAALSEMLGAAEADGVTGFYLASAYRSYDEQARIWENKLGSDPDHGKDGSPVVSMPPGSSEHQSALAFDISSLSHPSLSSGFAQTEQAQWLAAHAHEYGFILRYPEGKESLTGVVYEPWHFRYVGKEPAAYLFENGFVMEEVY